MMRTKASEPATTNDHSGRAMKRTPVPKLSPDEIKAIRDETGVNQTTFARHLWVSPPLVKRWESGASVPKGCALKLLHLVKKNGIEGLK